MEDLDSNVKLKLNIHQRMSAITNDVAKIPKNGRNNHGNYNYVRAVDLINAVSKLLVKHRISLSISDNLRERTTPIGKQIHSVIDCVAIFTNIDDPKEFISVNYSSVSADMVDKDIFKAKTNGLKYLFTQMFLVVTDDVKDTEQEVINHAPIRDPFTDLMIMIKSATKGYKETEYLKSILKHLGITESEELRAKSEADLQDMIIRLEEFMK